MKRIAITVGAALLAAIPATIGLVGNTSFAQSIPMRVPSQASVLDDNGGLRSHVEPGDDRSGSSATRPTDDRSGSSATTPSDDRSGTSATTPGDDRSGTSATTPGDDESGTSSSVTDDNGGHGGHGGDSSGSSGKDDGSGH